MISKEEAIKWIIGTDEEVSLELNIKELGDVITLASALDLVGEKIKKVQSESGSGQDLLVIGLFLRIHNTYKSIVREAMLGSWLDSECLIRTLIETLILLYEAIRDPSFVTKYELSQNILLERMTKKYIKDQNRSQKMLIQVENINPQEILDKIAKEGDGGWKLEKLAEINGLTALHDQIFQTYHNSVHSKPKAIKRHFSIENGVLLELIYRPKAEEPKNMLCAVLLIFSDAIKKYITHFKFNQFAKETDDIWTEIYKKSLEIGKKESEKKS